MSGVKAEPGIDAIIGQFRVHTKQTGGKSVPVPYRKHDTVYQAWSRVCPDFLKWVQARHVLTERVVGGAVIQIDTQASFYDETRPADQRKDLAVSSEAISPKLMQGAEHVSILLTAWKKQTADNSLRPPFDALGPYAPSIYTPQKRGKRNDTDSPSSDRGTPSRPSSLNLNDSNDNMGSSPSSGDQRGGETRFPEHGYQPRGGQPYFGQSGYQSGYALGDTLPSPYRSPPSLQHASQPGYPGFAAAQYPAFAHSASGGGMPPQAGYFNNVQGSGNTAPTAFGDHAAAAHAIAGNTSKGDMTITVSGGTASSSESDGPLGVPSKQDTNSKSISRVSVMPDDIEQVMNSFDQYQLNDMVTEGKTHRYDSAMPAQQFITMLQERMRAVVKLTGVSYMDAYNMEESAVKATTADAVKAHAKKYDVSEATGFIICINPPLLMTNYHVFATPSFVLPVARVQLDFTDKITAPVYSVLDPSSFFWSDRELDACIIAWTPSVNISDRVPIHLPAQAPPSGYGKNRRDTRLVVIGHPDGREMHVSLDGCRFKGAHKKYVVYNNDTEGGSSGSPVLNLVGDLVALHHCAFDKRASNLRHNRTQSEYQTNAGTDASLIFEKMLKQYELHKANGDLQKAAAFKTPLALDLAAPQSILTRLM